MIAAGNPAWRRTKAMRLSSTQDRRSFIKAAASFVGGSVAAGSLLSLGASTPATRARSQFDAKTPEPLIEPSEIRSVNGVLDLTMTAAPGPVQLGDRAFTGLLYNGAYVPPTLRARLGDTLRITFRNNLDPGLDRTRYIGPICAGAGTPSNLHFHGMSVSPQGNGDNVFVHIQPGKPSNTKCISLRLAGKVRDCFGITPMPTASSMIKSSVVYLAL